MDCEQNPYSLSSGLSKKVKVRFICKENTDYYD